jgi:Protein of Unknown function (DUF2784)
VCACWVRCTKIVPESNAFISIGLALSFERKADSPRGRPRLGALHVATLVYGVIIEIFSFWCPLTALEEWLEVRGNVSAYRGPFLLHYLDVVVYPDIPPNLLIAGAVAVCILNVGIYARRVHVRHSLG